MYQMRKHVWPSFEVGELGEKSMCTLLWPLRTRSSAEKGWDATDSDSQPVRLVRQRELRAHQEGQRTLLPSRSYEGSELRIRQAENIVT